MGCQEAGKAQPVRPARVPGRWAEQVGWVQLRLEGAQGARLAAPRMWPAASAGPSSVLAVSGWVGWGGAGVALRAASASPASRLCTVLGRSPPSTAGAGG